MANETTVNRTFKSTVFIMGFEDKKNLLELYNAMTGDFLFMNISPPITRIFRCVSLSIYPSFMRE